jgi:hypothetical protein
MHHTNTVRRSLIAGGTCDQNPETQALDVRRLAEQQGFEISTSIATGRRRQGEASCTRSDDGRRPSGHLML